MRETAELLRRTLGERIEVEAVVNGGLWNTFADPGQLENTLLNLTVNARDAMEDGGRLTLEVSNAFLDDRYAAAHEEVASGQYACIAMSDTGRGMDADTIARAFEPFFTTKSEGHGSGLGLAQVYGFAKQSGGMSRFTRSLVKARRSGYTCRATAGRPKRKSCATRPLPPEEQKPSWLWRTILACRKRWSRRLAA